MTHLSSIENSIAPVFQVPSKWARAEGKGALSTTCRDGSVPAGGSADGARASPCPATAADGNPSHRGAGRIGEVENRKPIPGGLKEGSKMFQVGRWVARQYGWLHIRA